MLQPFKFRVEQRIRYQHVDIQGVVYHVRYIDFLEVGRMEYLRNLGITIRNMNQKGYDFVNIEVHCYFKKPAYLDDMIIINTRLAWMRKSSFGFEYVLEREENGEILVTANTTHVMVHVHTFEPVRIPEEYRILFRHFEEGRLEELA